MPVKLRVDMSSANDAEATEFFKKHRPLFQAETTDIEFKSAGASSPPLPSQADVYKEMMQSIRQYATIRYILFPLYLTLTAVLVGAYFKDEYKIPLHLLLWAGLASSVVWWVFEYALSESLRATWNEVEKIIGKDKVFAAEAGDKGVNPLAHRAERIIYPPRFAFYFVYGVTASFWACLLYDICRCWLR